MLRTKFALPALALLFSHALVGTGCLITTGNANDDSGSADGSTGGEASSFTTASSMSATSADSSGSADDSVGETTGTPTGECSDNLIVDGGFEGGTPSTAWTEASVNFGTPICDTDCTEDPGADPFAGDWYAWFGGTDTDAEVASVSQSVTIDGQTAFLAFRFEINASSMTGDDFFEVTVDDTSVFLANDAEMADFDSYTPVSIDISDFADGQAHTITFTGDVLGNGLTNFFLDEVSLVTCVDSETTGSSSDGSSDGGSSSGTTASVDSSSGSDSGSDSGSSSDSGSGSSSSTGM